MHIISLVIGPHKAEDVLGVIIKTKCVTVHATFVSVFANGCLFLSVDGFRLLKVILPHSPRFKFPPVKNCKIKLGFFLTNTPEWLLWNNCVTFHTKIGNHILTLVSAISCVNFA